MKGGMVMEIIADATTTIETFAICRNEQSGDCDDVKCKLCEY